MKKYISIIAVLLLFTLINGCKKDSGGQKEEANRTFPEPAWKEDETGKYPLSMTAVVSLPENLKASLQAGDKLGAFIKEECRGLGVIVKVDATSSVFYVLVHGTASEQGKIRFNYYSKKTSYLYSTNEFLDFTVDGNYGTADAPGVLSLAPFK